MKKYPAKLLLFGEHTVNTGSKALAVPLPIFGGRWAYDTGLSAGQLAVRQMQLPQLCSYFEQLQAQGTLLADLDLPGFRRALNEGLVFESNIPTGYGAGSSGALVAAIFDRWGNKQAGSDLRKLKAALAQMEGFFHGTSSGTDPLICYLQKPVLLGLPEGAMPVAWEARPPDPRASYHLFLLDTGIQRQATPFIEYFLQKMELPAFRQSCSQYLLPAVDLAIGAFLQNDGRQLFTAMHGIGQFQLQFLEKMVPPPLRPVWQEGLDGQRFKLKICGAGGGGFMLGIATDFSLVENGLAGFKTFAVCPVG